MKNHCVSLEIAKDLKNAGWKKNTEFWWHPHNANPKQDTFFLTTKEKNPGMEIYRNIYSAPLATEILEELPSDLNIHILYITTSTNGKREFIIDRRDKTIHDETLPNALAKMWLYRKREEYPRELGG